MNSRLEIVTEILQNFLIREIIQHVVGAYMESKEYIDYQLWWPFDSKQTKFEPDVSLYVRHYSQLDYVLKFPQETITLFEGVPHGFDYRLRLACIYLGPAHPMRALPSARDQIQAIWHAVYRETTGSGGISTVYIFQTLPEHPLFEYRSNQRTPMVWAVQDGYALIPWSQGSFRKYQPAGMFQLVALILGLDGVPKQAVIILLDGAMTCDFILHSDPEHEQCLAYVVDLLAEQSSDTDTLRFITWELPR